MTQRTHLEDVLRGRIIGHLNWKYPRNLESPGVSSPCNFNVMAINRQSTSSDLSRQLSSATGTIVSRKTVYRRLGQINPNARRRATCVSLIATHCRLWFAWNKEHHAFWTPQQ
ncbi:transposable element Tcb1 transposase [Trichonephila clavipes]|nr:transposable element Tcb1 transposase [Trichonephila clavipes]